MSVEPPPLDGVASHYLGKLGRAYPDGVTTHGNDRSSNLAIIPRVVAQTPMVRSDQDVVFYIKVHIRVLREVSLITH